MPLIPIALALAPFVPDIVRWITGSDDAEAIAGKVVDIAKTVTGVSDPDEAKEAIIRDPNLAMQFQMAVIANRTDLQRMYLEDQKNQRQSELENIKDARQRDVKFLEAGRVNVRANVMLALDYVGIIVITLVVAGAFYLKIDPAGAALAFLCTIGGQLLANVRTAHDFEFGSSRSSQEKTITPADLITAGRAGRERDITPADLIDAGRAGKEG